MSASQTTSTLPRIFIGSTKESLEVANLIQEKLFHQAHGKVWSDPGLFEIGKVPIESIEEMLNNFPFGIFVMGAEDVVISRKKKFLAPRDNLIFELGLWIGRYGRQNAFMVLPFGEQPKLPSDLKGINVGQYKTMVDAQGVRSYDVSVACNQIIRAIQDAQKKKSSLS